MPESDESARTPPRPRRISAIVGRTFSALGHPGFRRFIIGQAISLSGTWLQLAAVRWLVYDLSRRESDLGVLDVASLLPGLVVGLIAGAIADRVTPRKMIIVMECTQMGLALALGLLVQMGWAGFWQMAAILALARICVTFELPSRQVFFYELVGPEILPNAIALNSGLFNATRVVGPALAGVCLAWLGASGCFFLNGVSFLAAIYAVASIQLERPKRAEPHASFTAREVLAGLRYLNEDRRLRAVFLLVSFFGIVGMGYDAMIPAYTRVAIGSDVSGYSILLACSGVGATLGAIFVASLPRQRRRDHWAPIGMLIFAFSLRGAAFIPGWYGSPVLQFWAAAACLTGAGFGAVVFYASCQTIVQLNSPEHLRGRIMGIWMIAFSGSVSLGSLWTGKASEVFGLVPVLAATAMFCGAAGVLVMATGVLAPRERVGRGPRGGP
ncbi:MAG: MFS transporter [Isosphaeraceae bacterium]